ncbi:MAG TPA: crosslink repair DNA glycosylase YcaQ family protein [Chryseosolibacter sp.]
MKPLTLSPSDARKIILHATGLSKRGQFGKGIEGAYKVIDHLGFVQIDTNYVVERAHHHTLASRVPDYKPEWISQLESDKRIFEFWTYATGYIPMRNFRYSLPVKQSFAARRKDLQQSEINLMKNVLDRIAREGPLTASDFENDRVTKSTGWWDWRPSKVALERLHLDGRLAITRKKDFRKVYDLTENTIPSDIDQTMPTPEEFSRYVIMQALKSFGIAYAKEIAFTARYVKTNIKAELERLADQNEICRVTVTGLKGPLYMLPTYKTKKITLAGDAFILSPFDVLNVFRHRLRDFFNFDYQIECFVPAAKRKYGYFSLPVLVGDTFVARMDSKADRKSQTLIVNNLHFETVKLSASTMEKLHDALNTFARFNQCDTVVIKKTNNKAFRTIYS